MEKVIIRAAVAEDAPMIARVLCMAFGLEESDPMFPLFLELAGREQTQYSFRNTIVAEVDSYVVGATIGYDGAKLHELRASTFELMQRYWGRTLEIENETNAGEFYLDSIAVFSDYRGRGIGRRLLEYFINQAFEEGFEAVGLLVDKENPRAEALYRSLGFARVNPTTFLGHPMWHMQVYAKKIGT